MAFLEDQSGLLHWKIFRGILVRPLGAKTAGGREAAGDAVTLICPFWAKHKKGQGEKVFLVPFVYMQPPSSHTWALLCTEDELGQVQKVRGVPLSEIAGVLPGTREVGGVDQSAALLARVEAFWLRWEKKARSDMVRKVEAEARKVAEAIGKMWLRSPLPEENPPCSRRRGPFASPPRCPRRCRESLRPGKRADGQLIFDKGSAFVSSWFRTFCHVQGVYKAESVTYLSRSNGRAETAGRQLFDKLAKLH